MKIIKIPFYLNYLNNSLYNILVNSSINLMEYTLFLRTLFVNSLYSPYIFINPYYINFLIQPFSNFSYNSLKINLFIYLFIIKKTIFLTFK